MKSSVRKRVLGVEIEAHPVVFPAAASLIVLFVVLTSLAPHRALMVFDEVQETIAHNLSWLYVFSMSLFLVFALALAFSQFGRIRLGPDNERPEFSTFSWFAMLFSAGMGIGMLFWGVAEPLYHFKGPLSAKPETLAAASEAMGVTLFHWGLHPWALYSLVALSLGYFGFRRGLPLSFRSVFYPLIGERIHGWIGNVIDIMAVLATLFGLATSLGLGAKQVNAGLNFVFGWPPQGTYVQVVIIACITTAAVASLVSGLHVGIKWLSNINMCIAGSILLFLFVVGPTVYLLDALVENTGAYLQTLPQNAFWTATYSGAAKASWFGSWTVFYWGWWIAWSPFVGMFIARISRGRTIREFVAGVLLVPTAVGLVWMTGFGNTALHQEIFEKVSLNAGALEETYDYKPRVHIVQELDPETGFAMPAAGQKGAAEGWLVAPDAKPVATPVDVLLKPTDADGVYRTRDGSRVEYLRSVLVHEGTDRPYWPGEEAVFDGKYAAREARLTLGDFLSAPVLNDNRDRRTDTTATSMFVMLAAYPLTWLTALLGTLSVILFFVTSSDSASMVADIIASGGSQNPTTGTRLFWGILEGCLAAVLLVAGGLVALQTGSITLGVPFCVIILGMCYSLVVGLKSELAGDIPDEHKQHALEGTFDD